MYCNMVFMGLFQPIYHSGASLRQFAGQMNRDGDMQMSDKGALIEIQDFAKPKLLGFLVVNPSNRHSI